MKWKWQTVYQDNRIKVRVSKKPPGLHVLAQPAATCLPITSDGKFILIHEKKASGHWVWGFPGGMIENGESASKAAARECEEEIGLKPSRTKKFAQVKTAFPDTSVTYVLGFDLKEGKKENWEGENIAATKKVSLHQLYQMALDTKLTDPRLVVAVLKLKKLIDQGKISLNKF